MKTPLHQVAALLSKRTLDSKVSSRRLGREIAAYLLEAGRTGELESLARELVRDRAAAGVVEVSAVSAHTLSAEALNEVRRQVKLFYPAAKRIIINEVRRADVIGGIRLEVVDRQLDLSLRSRLNRFKQLATSERTGSA